MHRLKILRILLTGKVQQLTKLTIPEGFTINEIVLELKKKKIINNVSEFNRFLAKKSNQPINKYLTNVPLQSFEGIFFPDTYFFSKNMSNRQVYNVFVKQFNSVFVPLYVNAKQQKLSFYDTLKLASIIEKEAGTQRNDLNFWGVFHNQLKNACTWHLAQRLDMPWGNQENDRSHTKTLNISPHLIHTETLGYHPLPLPHLVGKRF